MPDHATSADAAVQAQLDRLWALSPGADILGLERITALLARLGDPHRRLPPVFHVAGTNGKGSTCAFLRAALEAAGYRVHAYTSPHLVRFNERIRVAGRLIEDDALAPLLAEVLDVADGIGASFFEVTTAAAFLAFARAPADACVIEVGLGGRLDATNVIARPLVTGIAQLGIDHQSFLGDTAEAIAGEKAGIAKPGVPLVTMHYPASVAEVVRARAEARGGRLLPLDTAWTFDTGPDRLVVHAGGRTTAMPAPAMAGAHQAGNLALAAAMLLSQQVLAIPDAALVAAADVTWPARMQQLGPGPLRDTLPEHARLWLDGGHNAAAGAAIAEALTSIGTAGALRQSGDDAPPMADGPLGDHPRHLILGMLANKDPAGLLAPLAPLVDSIIAVPVPDHEHHAPSELARIARQLGIRAAGTAQDMPAALATLAPRLQVRIPATVLILGSLYLAGEVLRRNDELPS